MSTTPQRRWSVLAGEAWTLETSAQAFRVDWKGADGTVLTKTVVTADGEGTFTPPADGRYYVAARTAADAPWLRCGVLTAVALVDATEEWLVDQIEAIKVKIAAAESTHVQVGATDGTTLTRVSLPGLIRQKNLLENQLGNYRRRRAGIAPGRMVG